MAENAKPIICFHPLSEAERAKLLLRLDDLLRFLGAPGDWGYGTQLGDLTIELKRLRLRVQNGEDRRGA